MKIGKPIRKIRSEPEPETAPVEEPTPETEPAKEPVPA